MSYPSSGPLRIAFAAMVAFSLIGCSSLPVEKDQFETGSILILPPRNVVQNGEPHPKGKDSGETFAEMLAQKINSRTSFTANVSNDDSFSHSEMVEVGQAKSAASDKGSDYFFILKLGEFRDAAPMTFRKDFVTLEEAKLYRTDDGTVVWKLVQPYRETASNLGSYHGLLEAIAQRVSDTLP